MTALQLGIHVLSAVVLAGVVWRLGEMAPPPRWSRVRDRVVWLSAVTADLLLGCGMLASLFGRAELGWLLAVAGLALLFWLGWTQRARTQA